MSGASYWEFLIQLCPIAPIGLIYVLLIILFR